MPGPGNKKKKNQAIKQKQKTIRGSVPSTLANDVDEADGYVEKVNIICRLLEIPDVTTRSGLKLIHKDFEAVHGRLDSVFALFVNNDAIANGVIAIYAKMCADNILKDRLFFGKDILSDIMPLLNRKACRLVALQALCALSHHSSLELRTELAKKATNRLLDLLNEDSDDWRTTELVITVIDHCVSSLAGGKDIASAIVLRPFEVPRLLRAVVEQIRKATASSLLIDHALNMLVALALHCSVEFFNFSPAFNFLVACTRSPDIQTRGLAINGVLRLVVSKSQPDDGIYDAQAFLNAMEVRMPNHLVDALEDFGPVMKGEILQTAVGMRNFQDAMSKVIRDQDLYTLGLKISDLILKTEHSVVDGMFQSEDPITGQPDDYNFGLPFRRWPDSLPFCANALRARGDSSLLDKADIVDLKYFALKRKMDEAQVLVLKSLERNPKIPFFYYIRSLGSDQVDALRAAKKGLKCKGVADQDYVRNALLNRACEVASFLGLQRLQTAVTDKDWDEGIAFIMSAWKDAESYMKLAPPDARCMKTITYQHFLLGMIIKGCEISVDFGELEEGTTKLSLADQYGTYVGRPILKTQKRLARETIVSQMSAASKEWGDRVTAIAELHDYKSRKEPRAIEPQKSEDVLTAWLENVHIDGDDSTNAGPRTRMTHSRLHLNNVPLYQCSWCEATSAVLRKCSRCEKARYCDAPCQKNHWSIHRQTCSASTAA
ncbi:hypothetical protein SCHPADRAFT_870193 [Schizopora paradoxa]|uniref:MYND-type domain-containing protein n=1 Tax=Schizopora paradoxa TaxID=27342 RepID=A0A0H2RX10_9AGAM|nr:hypothetical protein SCHPADRAFT_870193 [Schizopora paradoxa]